MPIKQGHPVLFQRFSSVDIAFWLRYNGRPEKPLKTLTLLLLAAAVALASPIITTQCTLASVPLPCPADDGVARAGATAELTMTGLGTDTGLSIIAKTVAFSGVYNLPTQPGPLELATASAHASIAFIASTDGPVRSGLATFLVASNSGLGAGLGGGGSGDSSIQGLGSCNSNCNKSGLLVPFTLGTSFAISVSAFAQGRFGTSGGTIDGGDGSATLTLKVFELSGLPVAIFGPAAEVPEPGSIFLITVGAAMLSLRRFARRST